MKEEEKVKNFAEFQIWACGGYKFIVIHYSNHEFTRGQQLFNIHTHIH